MIPLRIAAWSALGLLPLFLPAPARPDKPAPAKPGDEMIDAYLARETARLSKRVLDGATTLAEWQQRRPRLRQEYLDMLGLWPLPEKTPLKATVTGTLERDGLVIEKLHFQSRPGLYVTGNLYRPKKIEGKLPAVLYVCGHSNRGRDGNKTAYQLHGFWFAKHGYVCLIVDSLMLGEVKGVHHGTYRRGRWWWQARGYTPAGVECWNGIRAIDYLLTRPDVDGKRLAVTGISGGGAATAWIAAADERVQCAVPVSGMSDLECYVSHKVINGHCDCMFLVNTYGWEWTTILALIAPRPLLFGNSDEDKIFPMDGNRRVIARLRQLYKLYGKPELVDAYVSHGPHADRTDLRVAAFQWINKHLKGETGPVQDTNLKPLPGEQLRVFPEEKDLPKDAINDRIDETFVPAAKVKLPEAKGFSSWMEGLLKQLRERSFRAFPKEIPAAAPVPKEAPFILTWIETEPGIKVGVELFQKGKPKSRAATLVVWDRLYIQGHSEIPYVLPPEWLDDGVGYLLGLRGVGKQFAWTEKSPPNYVARSHALLGKTVDEGRVRDIIATIRSLDKAYGHKRRWRVVGQGQGGIMAAYAALFEPAIQEVVIFNPPTSHREGPIFLNVLRVLDVPEALGLLAPRPLTLIEANDKAFDRTAQIYKLAGAADKLRRK